MKISKKIEVAINQQINRELYSGYLYLSMSAYFESINLQGFAHWMRVQTQEEEGHAMRLYKYLAERRGRVILNAIEAPEIEWKSPLDVFEHTYKHEQEVTKMIDSLVKLAEQEDDNATRVMLNWFVNEQVEEEAQAEIILKKLEMISGFKAGLMIMDKELAQRKKD